MAKPRNIHDLIGYWVNGGSQDTRVGNVFTYNDVLYDYGHHFPMAMRVPGGIAINGQRWSTTTSEHVRWVRGKANGQYVMVTHDSMKDAVRTPGKMPNTGEIMKTFSPNLLYEQTKTYGRFPSILAPQSITTLVFPWLADIHAPEGYGPSLDDKILNKRGLL
jgi:hypothetical protein